MDRAEFADYLWTYWVLCDLPVKAVDDDGILVQPMKAQSRLGQSVLPTRLISELCSDLRAKVVPGFEYQIDRDALAFARRAFVATLQERLRTRAHADASGYSDEQLDIFYPAKRFWAATSAFVGHPVYRRWRRLGSIDLREYLRPERLASAETYQPATPSMPFRGALFNGVKDRKIWVGVRDSADLETLLTFSHDSAVHPHFTKEERAELLQQPPGKKKWHAAPPANELRWINTAEDDYPFARPFRDSQTRFRDFCDTLLKAVAPAAGVPIGPITAYDDGTFLGVIGKLSVTYLPVGERTSSAELNRVLAEARQVHATTGFTPAAIAICCVANAGDIAAHLALVDDGEIPCDVVILDAAALRARLSHHPTVWSAYQGQNATLALLGTDDVRVRMLLANRSDTPELAEFPDHHPVVQRIIAEQVSRARLIGSEGSGKSIGLYQLASTPVLIVPARLAARDALLTQQCVIDLVAVGELPQLTSIIDDLHTRSDDSLRLISELTSPVPRDQHRLYVAYPTSHQDRLRDKLRWWFEAEQTVHTATLTPDERFLSKVAARYWHALGRPRLPTTLPSFAADVYRWDGLPLTAATVLGGAASDPSEEAIRDRVRRRENEFWQLMFDDVEAQSDAAVDLLEILAFLRMHGFERIPIDLAMFYFTTYRERESKELRAASRVLEKAGFILIAEDIVTPEVNVNPTATNVWGDPAALAALRTWTWKTAPADPAFTMERRQVLMLRIADAYDREGNIEQLRLVVDALRGEFPYHAETFLWQAITEARAGNATDAAEWITRYRRKNPEDLHAWLTIALAFERSGDHANYMRAMKRHIEEDLPLFAQRQEYKLLIAPGIGYYDAVELDEHWVSIQPANHDAFSSLLLLHVLEGEVDAALKVADRIAALPESQTFVTPELHVLPALREHAREYILAAAAFAPNYAFGAMHSWSAERRKRTVEYLQQHGQTTAVLLLRGELAFRENNLEGAAADFHAFLEQQQTNKDELSWVHLRLAEIYTYQAAFAKVVEVLDAFAPRTTFAIEDQLRYGMALYYTKRNAEAQQVLVALRRELSDPHDAVEYFLGRTYLEAEDGDRALAHFDACLRIRPGGPIAVLGRARSLVMLGRRDEAIADLRQFGATAVSAKFVEETLILFTELGAWTDAARFWQDAIRQHGNIPISESARRAITEHLHGKPPDAALSAVRWLLTQTPEAQ